MTNPAWFSDSGPGGALSATLKCGGRFPSVGIVSPSTVVVTTPPHDPGDRVTITPGTNPTLPTDPAKRAAFLGFSTLQTVNFDGRTVLYGLPLPASATDKVSISCWITQEGLAQGSLLHSPFTDVIDNNSIYFGPNFNIGSIQSGGVENGLGEVIHCKDCVLGLTAGPATTGGDSILKFSDLAGFSSDTYFHLMISLQGNGATAPANAVVYVNDTPLFNGALHGSLTAGVTFGFRAELLKDYPSVQIGSLSGYPSGAQNVWSIGSAFDNFANNTGNENAYVGAYPNPAGRGLRCGMTEYWMTLGHYVDWSDAATRAKFQTLDATLSHYVPVNLGAKGDTLTYAPTVYCTGGPANFTKNRANGQRLSLNGGSGETLFVANEGFVPLMIADDRVPGL